MQLTYLFFFSSFIDCVKFLKSPEPCEILGYYTASSGKFLPTFRDNPSSGFTNGFLNPEDGLSLNVGKELPLLAA